MTPEARLIALFRKKFTGKLKRIEDKTENGTPDSVCLLNGFTFWLEFKYLQAWPVKMSTKSRFKFRQEQLVFLYTWHRLPGGLAYALIQVGSDRIVISGETAYSIIMGDGLTKEEILKAAVHKQSKYSSFDVELLSKDLLHDIRKKLERDFEHVEKRNDTAVLQAASNIEKRLLDLVKRNNAWEDKLRLEEQKEQNRRNLLHRKRDQLKRNRERLDMVEAALNRKQKVINRKIRNRERKLKS